MKQAQSKKKILYFSLGIFILVSGIFAVNALIAGTRHAPTNVLVTINSQKMTLQEAIDGGYLNDGADTSSMPAETLSLSVGHNLDEIWVSIDGTEMTLANAIGGAGLCDPTPQTTIYLQPKPNPGHLASEIEVTTNSVTKTLQNAIDAGDFCCVNEAQATTCSGLCGAQTNNCGNPVDCGACCTPVDAAWSAITWSGSCSEICGPGIEYGTRTCGAASCGGNPVCPTDSYGSSTSVSRTCNLGAGACASGDQYCEPVYHNDEYGIWYTYIIYGCVINPATNCGSWGVIETCDSSGPCTMGASGYYCAYP